MLLRVAGILAFLLVASHCPLAFAQQSDAEPRGSPVSLLGTAGFGFGGGRLGGLYATAGLEAQVWPVHHMGIGARYLVLAAGAPDGNGTEGSAVTGLISYRSGSSSSGPTTTWFEASLGVGGARITGYDYSPTDGVFDTLGVVVMPRLAVIESWHHLAFGAALEVTAMPGQGAAGTVSLVAGVF